MHFEFAWGQNRFNSINSKYSIKWRLKIDLSIAWCIKIKWYLGKPCIWLHFKQKTILAVKKLTNRKAEEFFFLYNQNHFDINEKGFWIILEHQWIMFFFGLLCPKEGFKESCYKELENISLSFFISFWNVS